MRTGDDRRTVARQLTTRPLPHTMVDPTPVLRRPVPPPPLERPMEFDAPGFEASFGDDDDAGRSPGASRSGRRRGSRTAPRCVSVIVPVRNAEAWFDAQLQALADQHYPGNWEVVVADNGSTDGTVALARSWADRLPLRIVDASARPGINGARNLAAAEAVGDLLAFCDGDDLVNPGWVEALAEVAQRSDLVGGRLDEESLNPLASAQRPRMPAAALPVALGFLPFAVGANFAVWADVLDELGGFDERFLLGNDDVELSFRAQVHGHRLGYAPGAVVRYRHREGHAELFRQFRTYGRSEPLLFAEYRDRGMPRPSLAEVGRRWARIVVEAPVALHPRERASWLVLAGFSVGRLQGALRHRVLYL